MKTRKMRVLPKKTLKYDIIPRMQKNVVIHLRLETATGRNILAGILKRIRDRDNCAINIANDGEGFMRLASTASAIIADASANIDTIQKAVSDGKPVVLLNDCRISEHPSNLGHIRTDDGEIGFKAMEVLNSFKNKAVLRRLLVDALEVLHVPHAVPGAERNPRNHRLASKLTRHREMTVAPFLRVHRKTKLHLISPSSWKCRPRNSPDTTGRKSRRP